MTITRRQRPRIRPSWARIAILSAVGPLVLAVMAAVLGHEIHSARLIRQEVAKWKPIVTAPGFKIE